MANAVALLAVDSRALDFTPQESWRPLEGVRIPVLLFNDATGKIRYQPPVGWRYNGGGPVLTLYPPDVEEAFMKLTVVPHATGMPEITELPSPDLTKWCQQNYVPADAQEVKLVDENPSPFMINGKPSREFVFSYKATGKVFQTSVALLDWSEREHLAVVITARSTDYKTVHNTGVASLFSWSLRKSPDSTPAPGPTPITAQQR